MISTLPLFRFSSLLIYLSSLVAVSAIGNPLQPSPNVVSFCHIKSTINFRRQNYAQLKTGWIITWVEIENWGVKVQTNTKKVTSFPFGEQGRLQSQYHYFPDPICHEKDKIETSEENACKHLVKNVEKITAQYASDYKAVDTEIKGHRFEFLHQLNEFGDSKGAGKSGPYYGFVSHFSWLSKLPEAHQTPRRYLKDLCYCMSVPVQSFVKDNLKVEGDHLFPRYQYRNSPRNWYHSVLMKDGWKGKIKIPISELDERVSNSYHAAASKASFPTPPDGYDWYLAPYEEIDSNVSYSYVKDDENWKRFVKAQSGALTDSQLKANEFSVCTAQRLKATPKPSTPKPLQIAQDPPVIPPGAVAPKPGPPSLRIMPPATSKRTPSKLGMGTGIKMMPPTAIAVPTPDVNSRWKAKCQLSSAERSDLGLGFELDQKCCCTSRFRKLMVNSLNKFHFSGKDNDNRLEYCKEDDDGSSTDSVAFDLDMEQDPSCKSLERALATINAEADRDGKGLIWSCIPKDDQNPYPRLQVRRAQNASTKHCDDL